VRDAVLLNAAAALVALDGPTSSASLPDALRAGLGRAAESVDSGAASRALAAWVEASVDLAAS
jgi:anthranilate phosphoribosyltransferase